MGSCGTSCLKVILVIFNVLFWIFGLGLLGVGVWLKVDPEIANLGEAIKIGLDQSLVDIAAWILIGAGIWAFIVGFFGCCGAIRESQCLLGFYIVCLVFVFAAQVGLAIYVGIEYPKIIKAIEDTGAEWIKSDYDGESLVSRGFNYVQIEFCCCGVNDYRDYKGSEFLKDPETQIREGAYLSHACCRPSDANTAAGQESRNIDAVDWEGCVNDARALNGSAPVATTCDSQFRSEGCVDAITQWVEDNLPIALGVAAGVAGVQALIFAISVCLCVALRREEKGSH